MATATEQLQCTPPNDRFFTSSPTTSSPQDAHSRQWHFPGPSSRFNQRERASTHSRANFTQGANPASHTERRAHRRAHSSFNLSTSVSNHHDTFARKTFNARFTAPHSPSSSISARSPLSRFPSFTSAPAMAVTTPARNMHAKVQQHSPYSDYFTDDNRSIDEVASQSLPALATQQLLVRLNKLQSALMRGENDSQALYLVGRRMSEIEHDMDSLHSQSRQPPELEDSGLFMEEADEEEEEDTEHDIEKHSYTSLDGAMDKAASPIVESQSDSDSDNDKRDFLTKQSHEILVAIVKAQSELQERFNEVQSIKEQQMKILREKEVELQALRAENQHMQQDLSLDHGDFVLLDGQLRLIENQMTHLDGTVDNGLGLALDAMRADCRKAIEKVNSKRVRYSGCRARSGEQFDEGLKVGRWKMDVVRNPTGRVDSMVLERLSINEKDATPHFEISEVSAKLVDRQKRVLYTDQGAQAELPPPSPISDLESVESFEISADEYDPREELRQKALDDDLYSSDCAITTSPPSERGGTTTDNENIDDDETTKVAASTGGKPHKSAWHELWNGMADLAGVGEHRW